MEEIRELLKQRNLKATPTRVDVLTAIKNYEGAISSTEIHDSFQSSDRITLFRTLNSLLDGGLIHKANFESADTYYAMCSSTCTEKEHFHNHAHFRCSKCETVSCQQLKEAVKMSIPDYEIEKVDISITGLCSSCRNKK